MPTLTKAVNTEVVEVVEEGAGVEVAEVAEVAEEGGGCAHTILVQMVMLVRKPVVSVLVRISLHLSVSIPLTLPRPWI